jgi:hypothetical protein
MIHFNYTHPQGLDHEGKIIVSLDHAARGYYSESQFPLRLMHKDLSGKILWSTDLFPGIWSRYTMLTYTTLEVIDSLGNKLVDWKWDAFSHGDFAHQLFEIWALNNRGANGLAIGTHNGMTGEWVGPLNKGLIKGTLVEASDIQYMDLLKFYGNKSWVKCRKDLVTPDGGDIIFYEGGEGFTNSIVKESIETYVSPELITATNRSSVPINQLIEEISSDGPVRWIHLDVEGLDDKLILTIDSRLLPEILVYENENIGENSNTEVKDYLEENGYSVTYSGRNVIAYKV